MADILVAGPWIGELGWEVIAWQPMVRRIFLEGEYKECAIYTGKGRDHMYRFAQVQEMMNVPDHESECMAWRGFGDQKLLDDYNKLAQQMVERAKSEYGDSIDFFTLKNLERLN